jgi:hypothetical protein
LSTLLGKPALIYLNTAEITALVIGSSNRVGVDFLPATRTRSIAGWAEIERVDHRSGLMILEGTENGQAWSAAIGESNGKMSYSVVGDRVVVAAFGACLSR